MPGHHRPPDVAKPLDTETEQVKRPKKRGSGTRRPSSRQHPYPSEAEVQQPLFSQVEPPPPEALNTPAVPLPPVNASPPLLPTGDTPVATSAAHSAPPTQATTLSPSLGTNNPPKPGAESSPLGGVITVGGIDFHHASEAEFARMLNYYGIEWLYEPNQFPLQWRDGRPIEMFSPDFYLVEYDLYIELTTMRQSLVRRKNRKLRLLRALYPEINIKLLYRRDYQRLLERFGIKTDEMEAEMPASPPNPQNDDTLMGIEE